MRKRNNKLTERQKDFIKFYLDKWNGSRAARLAGYSARSAANIAYENMRKPHIRSIIDAYLEEESKERERIILERSMRGVNRSRK